MRVLQVDLTRYLVAQYQNPDKVIGSIKGRLHHNCTCMKPRTLYVKKEKYREQVARWPRRGLHNPAQYDDKGVVVYQAYRPPGTSLQSINTSAASASSPA